jgi:molybdate transport system substrate-binding protein
VPAVGVNMQVRAEKGPGRGSQLSRVIYAGILPFMTAVRRSIFARAVAVATSAVLLLTSLAPAVSRAESVTVFAAASLRDALDAQAARFGSVTGNKVVASYAGSNALAKQIEAGAPADVFISADLEWMDYLEQRKLLVAPSRTNLLRNALVLVAPASSATSLRIARGFGLAAALGGGKLAMANPDSVPAGKYAKAALEALDVWREVERQAVRSENVRAALALVARGEATFGIVYRTDALADKSVRIVDTFPDSSHPPIVYPAARIAARDTPAAQALLEFLRSAAAKAIWEKYGFAPF